MSFPASGRRLRQTLKMINRKINRQNFVVKQICYTFAGNNTCHGSRKITAPGQVFAFYSLTATFYTSKAGGYEL
jgi:hypothetical protein